MTIRSNRAARGMALALAAVLASGPAWAEKPSWAAEKGAKGRNGEQHQEREQRERREETRSRDRRVEHFNDQHRVAVREYYGEHYAKARRCPPGLAKKNNGCLPPGQAKKWQMGRPLPRDVIWYNVPPQLVVQLGVPPAGYKYVRVAGDILMIAVGTALVVDAIQDLGR